MAECCECGRTVPALSGGGRCHICELQGHLELIADLANAPCAPRPPECARCDGLRTALDRIAWWSNGCGYEPMGVLLERVHGIAADALQGDRVPSRVQGTDCAC